MARAPRGELEVAVELLGLRVDQLGELGVVTSDGGAAKGAATWERNPGGDARCGAIVVPAGATREDLYGVALNVARGMLAAGHTHGTFDIYDAALARQVERDFDVTAEPIAFEPLRPEQERAGVERRAVGWRYRVDLVDAVRQVEARRGA